MKLRAYLIVLLFSTLFNFSSSEHPLKLTASEIKYDSKTKSIRMDCKVFIDDFAPAINKTLMKKIINTNLSEDDKLAIENYFAINYKIYINDKIVPLKIKDYMVKSNVMNINFSKHYITLKKGDKLYIENNLLFREFGPLQSNWVTLRMPPFIPNSSFESKLERYTYSKIL